MCAYAYASAGFGESSTDLAFDAKLLIAENGAMLGHSERWQGAPSLIMADVDIEAIKRDRLHMGTFHDCAERQGGSWRVVDTGCDAEGNDCAGDLLRTVDPHPFVPSADGLLEGALRGDCQHTGGRTMPEAQCHAHPSPCDRHIGRTGFDLGSSRGGAGFRPPRP